MCVVARLPADVEAADRDVVRRIFLMRQQRWPDGTPAHPVNLPASSPLRDRFSEAVLGQSTKELAPYWNDRYFHGTRPPPSLASQEAVLLFVARTPGGVGYVTGSADRTMPAGVRTLFCLPTDTQAGAAWDREATAPRWTPRTILRHALLPWSLP